MCGCGCSSEEYTILLQLRVFKKREEKNNNQIFMERGSTGSLTNKTHLD